MPKNYHTSDTDRAARRKRLVAERMSAMGYPNPARYRLNRRAFTRPNWRRLIGKQRHVIALLFKGDLTDEQARVKFDRIKRHKKNGTLTFDNFAQAG